MRSSHYENREQRTKNKEAGTTEPENREPRTENRDLKIEDGR
jgi:hypothetical protein